MNHYEQKVIDECMDWFDFDRVHQAMQLLDWKWGMDDGAHIPEKGELRQSARKYIRMAIDGPCTTGSGGFEATAHFDGDGVLEGVTLRFILTDWYADTDEV